MRRPGEFSTSTATMLVAVSLGLTALTVAVVWLNINDLPAAQRGTAWWWFGGLATVTTIIAVAYQVVGWRNGSLTWDASQRQANQSATMRLVRPLLLPIAGIGAVVSFVVSPSFYVILGGLLAGFLVHLWMTLILRSTKTGRAMRAARRDEPQSE